MRLWHEQGNRTEAHALLAPVYGWFTEGFGTPVLQEAKALLARLALVRSRPAVSSGYLVRLGPRLPRTILEIRQPVPTNG